METLPDTSTVALLSSIPASVLPTTLFVTGIDIGYYHLGITSISYVLYKKRVWCRKEVLFNEMINLTRLPCPSLPCPLRHENCISDHMAHLFLVYADLFSWTDILLLEQQPPVSGMLAIQEALRTQYRAKAETVSPNAMHTWYRVAGKSKQERREHAVRLAEVELGIPILYRRKWDLADAIKMIHYYMCQKNEKLIRTTSRFFLPAIPKDESPAPPYP